MPSPYVQKLAKETGKPISEIELKWKQAKSLASENLGKKESEFIDEDYRYVVGTTKMLMGIYENVKVKDFLDSEMSAKDFVETVVSAQFGSIIPPVARKKDLLDQDEELPGEGKAPEKKPVVVQLHPKEQTAGREMLKCSNCGHKFIGLRESTPCPDCESTSSTSLSEVKTRKIEKTDKPEDAELATPPLHVDNPVELGKGANNVSENDLIDREFAFLDEGATQDFSTASPAMKEPLTKERVQAIIAQRRMQEENDDVDVESMNAFNRMIEAEKNHQ